MSRKNNTITISSTQKWTHFWVSVFASSIVSSFIGYLTNKCCGGTRKDGDHKDDSSNLDDSSGPGLSVPSFISKDKGGTFAALPSKDIDADVQKKHHKCCGGTRKDGDNKDDSSKLDGSSDSGPSVPPFVFKGGTFAALPSKDIDAGVQNKALTLRHQRNLVTESNEGYASTTLPFHSSSSDSSSPFLEGEQIQDRHTNDSDIASGRIAPDLTAVCTLKSSGTRVTARRGSVSETRKISNAKDTTKSKDLNKPSAVIMPSAPVASSSRDDTLITPASTPKGASKKKMFQGLTQKVHLAAMEGGGASAFLNIMLKESAQIKEAEEAEEAEAAAEAEDEEDEEDEEEDDNEEGDGVDGQDMTSDTMGLVSLFSLENESDQTVAGGNNNDMHDIS